MQLCLIYQKRETEDCMSFFFQPDEEMNWQAGQFLRYKLPNPQADTRGDQRYFSIASAPAENSIRVTTRIAKENGSSFKHDLQKLTVGDLLEANGPLGSFVINDPNKKYVFIAGGIGITPFRAIIFDLALEQKPLNITLIYANRNQDIVFKKELDQLATENPSLKIHYLIEPQKIDALTLQSLISDLFSPNYYLSGPKPMVEGVEKTLETLHVPKEQIKTDYFPGYDEI